MIKTKKQETELIKEKANFLDQHSGVILAKLKNPITYQETSNELQTLIFSNFSLDEIPEICANLLKETNGYEKRCYFSTISILFAVCNEINKNNLNDIQKENLKNVIREYTKKIKIHEDDDLRLNCQIVKLKKPVYNVNPK